jgi:hypothetical protein
LAIVTLTAFVPPACPTFEGLDWLFEWLQATTGSTATTTKTVAVNENLRD